MIEKKFRAPGNERTLQGSHSSASPGKEKRSAGDKKQDRKWRVDPFHAHLRKQGQGSNCRARFVLFACGLQNHMQFGTMTLLHMETHHHAL